MARKRLSVILCGLLVAMSLPGWAQYGGENVFQSLTFPGYTLKSGIGGQQISNFSADPNTFIDNPALLNKEVAYHPSLQYSFYVADIGISQLVMPLYFQETGTWAFGLRYFDYGQFDAYDELGYEEGEFSVNDWTLTVGKSHHLGPFTLGINMHLAHSSLVDYTATATMFDLGGIYQFPDRDWTVALAIKNLGWFWQDYSADSNSELPFDVQVGTTFKPRHMPFRFTVTIYDLAHTNITSTYDHQSAELEDGGTFNNIMRHVTIGAELLFSDHVHGRIGYNHRIRESLKLADQAGATGFTFGMMIRVKTLELSYSRFQYHVAGANNQVGLTVDINSIVKRKKLDDYGESGIE